MISHYTEIMGILGVAIQAAVLLPDAEDPDTVEYFDSLREHILECLTCIIHSLKDLNKQDLFNDYCLGVVNFLTKINEDKYNPTLVNRD
jgi:hypothetical protein